MDSNLMFHKPGYSMQENPLKWIDTSIGMWFLALLSLNIFDILITTPAWEANPVTLYLWGKIGIFLSASLKIGLVLLLGGLCQLARMVATPTEWALSRKVLKGILVVLVAFYAFVGVWNTIILGLATF